MIHYANGTSVDCFGSDVLISSIDEIISINLQCDYVLVIEKEAVFRTLASSSFFNKHRGLSQYGHRGLLITAKGYPDIATRHLLRRISDTIETSETPSARCVPLICLVDYDPHGVEILATYKFGSATMAHDSDTLATSCLKWLGVHAEDFLDSDMGVMEFNSRDRSKINNILEKEWLVETNSVRNWKNEIQCMSNRNKKAEIEVFTDKLSGGLAEYLDRKIGAQAWI